jgi:hypothetical protein
LNINLKLRRLISSLELWKTRNCTRKDIFSIPRTQGDTATRTLRQMREISSRSTKTRNRKLIYRIPTLPKRNSRMTGRPSSRRSLNTTTSRSTESSTKISTQKTTRNRKRTLERLPTSHQSLTKSSSLSEGQKVLFTVKLTSNHTVQKQKSKPKTKITLRTKMTKILKSIFFD